MKGIIATANLKLEKVSFESQNKILIEIINIKQKSYLSILVIKNN